MSPESRNAQAGHGSDEKPRLEAPPPRPRREIGKIRGEDLPCASCLPPKVRSKFLAKHIPPHVGLPPRARGYAGANCGPGRRPGRGGLSSARLKADVPGVPARTGSSGLDTAGPRPCLRGRRGVRDSSPGRPGRPRWARRRARGSLAGPQIAAPGVQVPGARPGEAGPGPHARTAVRAGPHKAARAHGGPGVRLLPPASGPEGPSAAADVHPDSGIRGTGWRPCFLGRQ